MTDASALRRLHDRLARQTMTDDQRAMERDIDIRIRQLIAELGDPAALAEIIEEVQRGQV